MKARRVLKLLHFGGTVWFVVAAAYILVVALRQAGVNWWLIFSLSGHGAALLFLLISAYLYVLFRDNGSRDPQKAVEHPLTNTNQYMILYSLIPFLGAMAGMYSIIEFETGKQFGTAVTMGTLAATFVFWIIVDPAISFAEKFLPESRKHAAARHAAVKAMRELKQKEREQMLVDIEMDEKIRIRNLQQSLAPEAQRLAAITLEAIDGSPAAQSEAIKIGLAAWRSGGLECMQKLHDMTADICSRCNRQPSDEYISICWDGIGHWRHKLLT
jgi:hypothetical protein